MAESGTNLGTRLARVALALVLALAACSSGGAATECDSAQCAAGNTCIATAGAPSQCEFPCATNTDCPFNYHCDANPGGTSPYCVLNTTTFPDKPGTQFGAPCNPSDGFQNNPACDTTDGFWCNATSPLDGNAFCTYFGCKVDTDCGGGFYCGAVNQYPNAVTRSSRTDRRSPPACRATTAPRARRTSTAPRRTAPRSTASRGPIR